MKKYNLLVVIVFLLLGACSSTTSITQTSKEIPTTTVKTPFTPPISPTYTLTPVPTATHTPTHTAIPTLLFELFEVRIVGMGIHGNMACIEYKGEVTDITEVTLFATFYQSCSIVEKDIELEIINGNLCFEMVDAMYGIAPIEIEINTILPRDSIFELSEESKTQTYRLSEYQWVPFLEWIFGESNLSNIINVPNPKHEEAYDFAPSYSAEYPNGLGHPVFIPSDAQIIKTTLTDDRNSIWAYLPDVGFYLKLGHAKPTITSSGKKVESGAIVGHLTNETGWPHIEMELRIPKMWPVNVRNKDNISGRSGFIDFANPHAQLDGNKLEFGFWLPENLPQQLKCLFENNIFIPNYDSSRYMIRFNICQEE